MVAAKPEYFTTIEKLGINKDGYEAFTEKNLLPFSDFLA